MLEFDDALFEILFLGFEDGNSGAFGDALRQKDAGTNEAGGAEDGKDDGRGDKVVFDLWLVGAADGSGEGARFGSR